MPPDFVEPYLVVLMQSKNPPHTRGLSRESGGLSCLSHYNYWRVHVKIYMMLNKGIELYYQREV